MENIFKVVKTFSVLGMSYVGWNYGSYIKHCINTPTVKPYKDKVIIFNDNSVFNENVFCSTTSSLCGMLLGRVLWPVCIPFIFYDVETRHGSNIRKFLKELKKD